MFVGLYHHTDAYILLLFNHWKNIQWINKQVIIQTYIYAHISCTTDRVSLYNKHLCCLLQNARDVISLLHFSHGELLGFLIIFISGIWRYGFGKLSSLGNLITRICWRAEGNFNLAKRKNHLWCILHCCAEFQSQTIGIRCNKYLWNPGNKQQDWGIGSIW